MCNDNEKVYQWEVPFGLFHLDGRWEPNPNLSMTADEQRKHNESIGVLPPQKWPIDVEVVFDSDVTVQPNPTREPLLYGPKLLKAKHHAK